MYRRPARSISCAYAASANEPDKDELCDEQTHLGTGRENLHPEDYVGLFEFMCLFYFCNLFTAFSTRLSKAYDSHRNVMPTIPYSMCSSYMFRPDALIFISSSLCSHAMLANIESPGLILTCTSSTSYSFRHHPCSAAEACLA